MSTVPAPLGGAAEACLRLAFNFAPARQRERLQAATALRDAVLASATTSIERQVCETQLAWWRDELTRTAAGEPRHPLAVALAHRKSLDDNAQALLLEWPVLAARALDGAPPDSANQWRISAFRQHATVMMLSIDAQALRATLVPGFRDCAVALSLLDGGTEDRDVLDSTAVALATHAADSDHVALVALATLAGQALQRLRENQPAAGAVRQLFTAWRSARTARRRQIQSDTSQ